MKFRIEQKFCTNCGAEMEEECLVCKQVPVKPFDFAAKMRQAQLRPEDIACDQLIESMSSGANEDLETEYEPGVATEL